jgi:lysophospholipase L1-like esterase
VRWLSLFLCLLCAMTEKAQTVAQWNQLAGNGLVSGAQAIYLFSEGSGTTVHDSSGNGNDCTFNVTHPPTWASPRGVNFSGNQFMTCPAAAFNGAQTIMIVYNSQTHIPGTVVPNGHYSILSTDTNNARLDFDTTSSGWGAGPAMYNPGNGKFLEACDKAIGLSSVTVTLGSGVPAIYVNGHPATSVKQALSGQLTSFPVTTTAFIGQFQANNNTENFKGQIQAIVVYSTVRSVADIAQNELALESILAQSALKIQDATSYDSPLWIADGDSIIEGGGVVNYFQNSIPFYSSQFMGNFLTTYNVALGGQSFSNLNPQYALKVSPLVKQFANAVKIVSIASGTNDIIGGITAANLQTAINTYCASVAADGATCVYEDILPRSTFSGANQTTANTVNAAIIAEWLAGTNNISYVVDRAGSPIMGQAPNITANATYYPDGTHPSALGNQILGQLEGLGVWSVARPGIPYWTKITLNSLVPSAAGLTQTINLLQLGPKQKVCGVTQRVTTAFTASGLASLTSSVGSSGGNATTYSSTLSLTATGFQDNGLPASPPTDKGIVTANFTASGANLNTLTAGSVDYDLCLVTQP